MEREILFRGKTDDSGSWVKGDLVQRIDSDGSKYSLIENNDFHDYRSYVVMAETVGQFTGLSDKNGKKIFEGDILEVDGGYEICNTEVKWDNELGGWTDRRDFDGDSFRCHEGLMSWCQYTKIIGNIHDMEKEESNV